MRASWSFSGLKTWMSRTFWNLVKWETHEGKDFSGSSEVIQLFHPLSEKLIDLANLGTVTAR